MFSIIIHCIVQLKKIYGEGTSFGAHQNQKVCFVHWALKVLNTFYCELLYDKDLIFKMFILSVLSEKM